MKLNRKRFILENADISRIDYARKMRYDGQRERIEYSMVVMYRLLET